MLNAMGDFARGCNRLLAGSAWSQKLLRTLPVPEDLASVSDIDFASETDPYEAGLSPRIINDIWQAMQDLYCTGYYPALMLCIRRRGKIVFNRAIGYAGGFLPGSREAPRLATVNTPACLYSASKALTAMLMHKLSEDEQIDMLDAISHYIPEFAVKGKQHLSIYQLLSHRGGVPGIPAVTSVEQLVDHEAMLKLICASRPLHPQGRVQAYHALTSGYLLQEILERVTGDSIQNYWHQQFKQPMQMRYLEYGATHETYDLMARDYITGAYIPDFISDRLQDLLGANIERDKQLFNDYRFFAQPIPAGNMVGTAEEACRFFQMLLDKGEYQGQQLLERRTVKHAINESSPHRFDNSLKLPIRYSPGMMLGGDPIGYFGWRSGRAFGHLGLMNNLIWADPQRVMSVALLATGKPLLAHNLPFLVNLVSTITSRIPRDSGSR